jgi:hypothetical protein
MSGETPDELAMASPGRTRRSDDDLRTIELIAVPGRIHRPKKVASKH